MDPKKHGTVMWFNDHKGYGFIKGEDNKSYFFHYTSIIGPEGKRKTIANGAAVRFGLGLNEKGTIAIDVEDISQEG